MVMRAILAARMVELARRCSASSSLTTRNEPDMPRCIRSTSPEAKVGHQVFGAAAETGHGLAGQPRDEIPLERKPQVFAPDFRFHDPRPLHDRLQAAADGLDFG